MFIPPHIATAFWFKGCPSMPRHQTREPQTFLGRTLLWNSLSLSLYIYIYIYIYHNFENPPPHAYRRCADHARAHEAPDTFFQCCSEPSEVQSLSTQIGHRRERNIIPAKIRRLKLLGKSRWTWEVHPLESRFCLSQSLWDPESQYGDWPQKRAREVGAEAPPCNIYDSNHTML